MTTTTVPSITDELLAELEQQAEEVESIGHDADIERRAIAHIRSLSDRLDLMREVANDVLWCIDTGPSCQIGVVERCKCSMCVAGRLRVAIAQEGKSHE